MRLASALVISSLPDIVAALLLTCFELRLTGSLLVVGLIDRRAEALRNDNREVLSARTEPPTYSSISSLLPAARWCRPAVPCGLTGVPVKDVPQAAIAPMQSSGHQPHHCLLLA